MIMRQLLFFCLCLAPLVLPAQLNLEKIGYLSFDGRTLAGCKHHVDSSGGEWALIGHSQGMSIVDLQDPTQPKERFVVPGKPNNWREVRTWGGFAYVGSEADSSGITIVDLRHLPDTIYWKNWFGNGAFEGKVRRSHTVQAVDGYLYIFGGGNITSGCVIADLSDPWTPKITGRYSLRYCHDGFIRGDTLWTSELGDGFAVVDIRDRRDPQFIIAQPTPAKFNHNTELSPDGRTLFAADEIPKAPLASFDVSDLANIRLLDQYFPSQKPDFEVHNVRVLGNFLVNPSYGGQLTIVDAHRPDNLIETAWYVMGNSLVWDADPYLPSGIVFATAKQEGLFVFKPSYQRASYLEGTISDAVTGLPLSRAYIAIQDSIGQDSSNTFGRYKTGLLGTGAYDVVVNKSGYKPKRISNVPLSAGEVTELHVALEPLANASSSLSLLQAKVSPTVFSDHLDIFFAAENPYDMLQMFDFQGKMIVQKNISNQKTFTLDGLQHLQAGPYLLKFLGRDNNGQMRIIKH